MLMWLPKLPMRSVWIPSKPATLIVPKVLLTARLLSRAPFWSKPSRNATKEESANVMSKLRKSNAPPA